jgi:hypothetical protein
MYYIKISAELVKDTYIQTEWDEPCQIRIPSLTLHVHANDYKVFVAYCYFEGPENHAYVNFGSPHIMQT